METSLKLLKENRSLAFKLCGVDDFEKYAKTVESLFITLENRWQKLEITKKLKL